MGLDFAVEQLVATGWLPLDTRGCERLEDGQPYPTPERVAQEFAESDLVLSVRHVQLFDCYRAEWTARDGGEPAGAVVGHTLEEAAVYALSQMRRSLVAASV